jgi:hypothetical protein
MGGSEKMCQHGWIVYSTAIATQVIMVYCEKCSARGYVEDFSEEEWNDAFWAPEQSYPWQGKGTVKISKPKTAKL